MFGFRNTTRRLSPRHLTTCVLLPMALLFLLLSTGCGIADALNPVKDATTQALAAVDDAINALASANADWEAILKDLENKIPAQIDSTIKNEISNTLTRAEATAGTEFKCGVDFVADRAREHLLRVKAELLKQTPPPVEPTFCNVIPLAIDMNLTPERRNVVEYYGYDMDTANVQVLLQTTGGIQDLTSRLARPTHYHMTVNLGGTPNPLGANSEKLILKWNGQEISSISVLQPTTPVCKSSVSPGIVQQPITYTPPAVRGDHEFDGNGPDIDASVTLSVQGSGAENRVVATIYMDARETKSDWTEAQGSKTVTLYTAPPGMKIEKIVGGPVSTYHYRDTNHTIDRFGGGAGEPVSQWEFMGDGTTSQDAGGDTHVTVHLNPLRVVLTETTNCVSPSTLGEMLNSRFLSAGTLQRFTPQLRKINPDLFKMIPSLKSLP